MKPRRVLPGVYAYRGAFVSNDGVRCWSICYRKDGGAIDEAGWMKMEAMEEDEGNLPWDDMDSRCSFRSLKDATQWWNNFLDTKAAVS